jgi:5,10-methylenetetrahydromethanopterin reductase
MVNLGLMLPDEAFDLTVDDTVHFAKYAEEAGFDSVWKGEASWGNGPMTLAAIARETDDITLGTGIANVFSRTPALLAMSGATLDDLSDGRTVLGLGVSAPPVVEEFHGLSFERPLRRMRETIEILQQAFEGDTLEYEGDIFDVGPYSVGFDIERDSIPIYNAAMGETNCRLTGEFADGWLPAFIPHSELDSAQEAITEGAQNADRDPDDITVAPMVGAAVDDDLEVAADHARRFLAQEMAMGYNRLAEKFGFGEAGNAAHDLFREGDREGAAAAITDEMLEELAIYGTPEQFRADIQRYADAGCDTVVLFPPYSASESMLEAIIDEA